MFGFEGVGLGRGGFLWVVSGGRRGEGSRTRVLWSKAKLVELAGS